MAKRAGKKSAAKRKPRGSGEAPPFPFPFPIAGDGSIDPHEVFAMLAEAMGVPLPPGGLPGKRPRPKRRNTPRGKAEALVEEADRLDPHEHPAEREELARKALDLEPDLAEAWCVRADQAATADEAVTLFEAAVAAGERSLGEAAFARRSGSIGDLPGGAGFLRAGIGLSHALAACGRQPEAIEACRRLLDVDCHDRTGAGAFLVALAIGERRWAEARAMLPALVERDDLDGAWWGTLVEFAEHGDSPAARASLARAVKINAIVGSLLLDDELDDRKSSGPFAIQAEVYARTDLPTWRDVPGAIAWLRGALDAAREAKARRGRKKMAGNDPRQLRMPAIDAPTGPELAALPQEPRDVWQVDVRLLPMWVGDEDRLRRPWGLFVASAPRDRIIDHDMFAERPTDAELAVAVAAVLRQEGVRPAAIEVVDPELREALAETLDGSEIAVVPRDELPAVDHMVEMLSIKLSERGDDRPFLDLPGVTPAIMEELHAAAAAFHRARPWRRLPVDTPILVRGGPSWAPEIGTIVLGKSGVQQGLAIYLDAESLRATVEHDEEAMERGRALSVLYGEAFEIPGIDLHTIERLGFEVAGPEGYPTVVGIEPGLTRRQPDGREIELASRLLRAVPAFIDAVPRTSVNRWRSPCGLELSWG